MKNLKLNKLSKHNMQELVGGVPITFKCNCACAYINSGGSSSQYNGFTNSSRRLNSPQSGQEYTVTIHF